VCSREAASTHLAFAVVRGAGSLRTRPRPARSAADLFHLLDNNTDVPTISQYGGVGLLDTRTARFMPDRYLVGSVSLKNPDDRLAATFQALPWLEATFRWANNYAARSALSPGQGADRSFDIKVRLWEERNGVPEVAFGLQDFLGTALYGGANTLSDPSSLDGLTSHWASVGDGSRPEAPSTMRSQLYSQASKIVPSLPVPAATQHGTTFAVLTWEYLAASNTNRAFTT
jgi:hypothetical protein